MRNNIIRLKILILLLIWGNFMYAQNVGVGTTSPTHKLHVAGNARVTIKPQALVTDSVVMRFSDGELRQMSVARFIGQLDTDGDGIIDFDDPDIDGDGIANSLDSCRMQYGCTPSGCPRSCNCISTIGTIASLNCAGARNIGTLTSGTAASGVSSRLPYTGGNGGTYTAFSVASTGVTGLTASIAAGTLVSGADSFTVTITGTPASVGTASFVINIGGQTCTLTRTVSSSFVYCNCHANKRILVVNFGAPYNQIYSNIQSAYTGLGFTVTAVTALPGTLTSAVSDPTNGYTAILMGGDISLTTSQNTQLSNYINSGGKVFMTGELGGYQGLAGSVAAVNAIVPGASISSVTSGYCNLGLPAFTLSGCSSNGNTAITGNAYGPLYGVSSSNQILATPLGGSSTAACTGNIAGFKYPLGSNGGYLSGIMDLNFWYNGYEPTGTAPNGVVSSNVLNYVMCCLLCP